MKSYVLLAVLGVLPFSAAAQKQSSASPQPADPAVRVPATNYESAFSGYMTYREEKLSPWREVNDEVSRAGGHVGIFGGSHAGHGGTAKPGPSKPTPSVPAAGRKREPAGQAPARSAPKPPERGHEGH